MATMTVGERDLLLKATKQEFVTCDHDSKDHKRAEDMVDKGWLNRAFIRGNRSDYSILPDGWTALKDIGALP
jgi:hypothetical protein